MIKVFSPRILKDTDVFGVSNPSALIENHAGIIINITASKGSFKFQYEITKSLKAATLFGIIL
jgi:hypothetical protein